MTMMLMSINSSSLSSMVPPPYKRIRFHFLRREDLYIYGAAAAFNLLLAIIQGFRHLTSAYGFTSYVVKSCLSTAKFLLLSSTSEYTRLRLAAL